MKSYAQWKLSKKGQWKNINGLLCKISPETFINAVEQQVDSFDKILYKRHLRSS